MNYNKENITEYLNNYSGEKIVLFGASGCALKLMDSFAIDNILCLCDSSLDKQGKKFNGYNVISPQELMNIKEPIYLIVSSSFFSDILNQLKSLNYPGRIDVEQAIYYRKILKEKNKRFSHGRVYFEDVMELLCDDISKKTYEGAINARLGLTDYGDFSKVKSLSSMYFDKSILSFSEEEIYIDAGAIGTSSFDFIKSVDGKYKKIYCFEPGNEGYKKLCKDYEDRSIPKNKYEIFNAGIYSESKKSSYSNLAPGGHGNFVTESHPSDREDDNCDKMEIQLYALDDIIKDGVTFIKMDIEGSELEAIRGAENIIKKYKPKLAICLYHKITDFWDIPLEIHRICPEYKIYIRHYTNSLLDTVLYAQILDATEN